ncbi:unnamed protein product [Victoria cruziana]
MRRPPRVAPLVRHPLLLSPCSSIPFVLLQFLLQFFISSSFPLHPWLVFRVDSTLDESRSSSFPLAFRVDSTLGQAIKLMEEWLDQPAHPSCALHPCLVCKGEHSVLM